MNRRVWGAVGIALLALECLFTQAHAGLLNRQDIEKLLDGQYMVGEVQAGMPVYPLFAKNPASAGKPDLKGYAFESIDFKPIRGYSGKPIDVLVAMDLTGGFMDVRLVDHKEPFFNNPTGTTRLGNFAAQYIDLSLQHSIQVHDHTTPTARDERSADLQGVNHGTVSVKAIDQSIVVSAAMVAIGKLGMTDTGSASRRRSSGEHYKPLTWAVMVSRGMVSTTTFTRGDFARAFANTRSADADVLATKQPNDPALIFHTALISLP
jgi:transcriptional regulator of nitric oxide reductase